MGLGHAEQRFVAVHEAELRPEVVDGIEEQAPEVEDEVQEGMEAMANDAGVEIIALEQMLEAQWFCWVVHGEGFLGYLKY